MPRFSQSDLMSFLEDRRLVKAKQVSTPARGQKPQPIQSVMLNKHSRLMSHGKNIVDPNRAISYRVLRRVSEKAWLINTIIGHLSNRVRPFMKRSTDENIRGFQVRLKDDTKKPTREQQKRMEELEEFFLKTGFGEDPDREDSLTEFAVKGIRDVLTLDQLTTELQHTRGNDLWAFWAIDPSTIYRVDEQGYDGDDKIKFIQEIDGVTTATYTRDELIFDYMNPRTDIEHSGYGYSYVEQAIDLIIAQINTFAYNMGVFTEDRLPRGMLMINGDADLEDAEALEEYIIDVMSGHPSAKHHIPVIAGGKSGTGQSNDRKIEWVSFQNSNREMEFIQWTEFLWSAVAALFGIDLEELGIKTSKSTALIGENMQPRIAESKSRGLSSILGFLEDHYQTILDRIDPDYDFEFVGYEKDDPKQKNETREAALRTYKSIDELRAEEDLKPFDEEWSKMPLNPHAVQIFQAAQQAEMMGGMGGEEGDPMGGGMPGGEEAMPGGEEGFVDEDGEGEESGEELYRRMMMGENPEEPAEGDDAYRRMMQGDNPDEAVAKSIEDGTEIIIEV